MPRMDIQTLVETAQCLRATRTTAMQQGDGFTSLLPGEAEWLASAYAPGDGEPHAWITRHPTLIVGLLEAYPAIRLAYPDLPLILSRPRYSDDNNDADTEEEDILDETYEGKCPEIVVDQEWLPEPVFDAAGDPCPWLFAEEAECGPIGRAMHQESDRLNAVLGEQRHWRAEWWWGRRGANGGYVVVFTPYGEIDHVLSDLVSNEELDRLIVQEGEEIEKPEETIDLAGAGTISYQPGDREYLEVLINERMRRESLGIYFPPRYESPPLTAEERRHLDEYVEYGFDPDTDPVRKKSLDAEGDRLHAERLAMLRRLRDARRAMRS